MRTRYFEGGGTGNSPSATLTHLSPSSINMTGMSSTMGYLRAQSWQMNQASLCSLSSPPVVRTQFGQRRISISVSLTIDSPFLVLSAVELLTELELNLNSLRQQFNCRRNLRAAV